MKKISQFYWFAPLAAMCLMAVFCIMNVAVGSTTIATYVQTGGAIYGSSTLMLDGASTFNGSNTFGNAVTDINLFTGRLQASTTALFTGTATFYGIANIANASSTLASFGTGGTTVSAILYGSCIPTIGTVTGSTTLSAICTGSSAVDSVNYKVFVTPYITDPTIQFVSASSTASGIQVSVYNTGTRGDVDPADNSWSWMAIK